MTQKRGIVIFAALLLAGAAVSFVFLSEKSPIRSESAGATVEGIVEKKVSHLAMPEKVKGIYLTAPTAADGKRFQTLLDLIERTELNAVVIDIKADRGELAFVPEAESLKGVPSIPIIPSLQELTAELHERGIYAIARVTVFQDPSYAAHSPWGLRHAGGGLWGDRKGVRWTDPAAEGVWKYNVEVAREAHTRGFDEIQFDYVRFPTDGNLKNIVYPVWDGKESRRAVMRRFFAFLEQELVLRDIPVSVDLFGLAVRLDESDIGIGQHASDALPHVTVVSPMMYPSHYGPGSYGFPNPAASPGGIIKKGMEIARTLQERAPEARGTFRPWLQDFDIGANYDGPKVRAQIEAAEAGGASGWLLWNARNVYTEAGLKAKEGGE